MPITIFILIYIYISYYIIYIVLYSYLHIHIPVPIIPWWIKLPINPYQYPYHITTLSCFPFFISPLYHMFWWLNHCQPIILMVTWCKLYPSNLTISLPPIISTWYPNSWWSVHRQAALHMISQQLVKCSSTLPHHISPNIIAVLNSFISPTIQKVNHYSNNINY